MSFLSVRLATFAVAAFVLSSAAYATDLPLVADASTSSVSGRTSTNYGSSSNLYVSSTANTYLMFDTTQLPSGTTAAQVSKATLLVFVNRVNTSGSVSVNICTTAFTESAVTSAAAPTCATSTATFTPSVAGVYIPVDVTTAIKNIVGGTTNDGFSLTTSAADVVFDSKENDQTAHPAKLDVTLAPGTTLAAATAAGQIYISQASGSAPPTPNTISGDLTLGASGTATIATAAVTGSKIASQTITSSNLANLAVTSATIDTSAVATANIAPNAVTIAKLPTGATATTYLRGDGTWATPTGTAASGATPIGVPYTLTGHSGSFIYSHPTSSAQSATAGPTTTILIPSNCYVSMTIYSYTGSANNWALYTVIPSTSSATWSANIEVLSCATTGFLGATCSATGAFSAGTLLTLAPVNLTNPGGGGYLSAFSCQ